MKRTRVADRSVNEERIVRRKGRSTSPEVQVDTRKREVRNTALYDKYEDKYEDKYTEKYKYSDKYDKYDHRSHGKPQHEERPRHQYSARDHTATHHVARGNEFKPGRKFTDKFEYSVRVSNIEFKLADSEVKTGLFKLFKRYGFINVKVLGYGKERHAFINFTCEADARKARKELQDYHFHARPLRVEWSKATLNRFPGLQTNDGTSTYKRRSVHTEETYEEYPRERRTSDHYSSRNTRDISYKSTSPTTHSHSSSSHHNTHSTSSHHHHSTSSSGSHQEAKSVVPVIDPSATRTLFVGNLEQDITERELRDLFGPYGRIESVDIKLQRSTGTAYAFVKFLTINDAINAKNDMHGRQYGEYRLKIGFGRGSPSAKVWIGNLSSFADMSEVRHELDRFGLIRRVDYNGDNHAFVHFDSLDAAQAAVSALSGYRIRGSGRPLKIDISRPAHMRAEYEEYEHQQQQQEFHSSRSSHAHSDSSRRPVSRASDEALSSGGGGGGGNYRRRVKDRLYSSENATEGRNTSLSTPYKGAGSGGKYFNQSTGTHRSRSFDRSERSNPRKRAHSPSFDDYDTGGYRQRARGDNSMNGDTLYRPKRPRNGIESHRSRDREQMKGRSSPPMHEPMDTSGDGASSSVKAPSERKDNNSPDKRRPAEPDRVSAVQMEPAPSDMILSDTALKLHDSTEPISPDSDSKSMKPDSTNPETLVDMAKLFPVAWRGNLVLKNTGFPTRMHLIGGDPTVAETLLRSKDGKDDLSALRITQRLRLEPPRLEEVNKRMSSAGPSGHCILLALPGPTPSQSSPEQNSEETMQLRPLRSLVSYLKQKEAAGIVALSSSESNEAATGEKDVRDVIGVLHAFPPCQFSQSQLLKIAPNLGSEPSKEDHIVVLLVKGTV